MPNYEDKPMNEMPAEGEVSIEVEIESAEMADEDMYAEIAPRSTNRPFSTKALNNLVKATNRLLPMFDQDPDYPEFTQAIEVFPTDFVRVLAMFQGAVNEACDLDMCNEELDFVMEDITDDASIMAVAGKIDRLARDRDFKNYLKNPPERMEEEEEVVSGAETAMEGAEMSDEQMDALFTQRV